MSLSAMRQLVLAAINGWFDDRAPSMGAAIAYYTVFSLAPMLLLVIVIAGLAFGEEAAEGAIMGQLSELIGRQGAGAIQGMIASADKSGSNVAATVASLVLLAVAATTVFGELQSSLNVIWKAAPPARSTFFNLLRTRLLSLSLIVGIAFLLLVSLAVSAALTGFAGFLNRAFPHLDLILRLINVVLSFGVTAALFAMIYKLLPRHPDRVGRRGHRRPHGIAPVHDRQVRDQPVHRQSGRRLGVRRRCGARDHPAVGLLRRADLPVRRRVRQGLRRALRLTSRSPPPSRRAKGGARDPRMTDLLDELP
jgi:hypothetical protein